MSIQYVDKNADLVGTAAETFNISGTNNQLQITMDGGTTQNITLGNGSARTAAQVASDINTSLVGGTAYAVGSGPQSNHVRIRSTSANGASSTILIGAPANNCNTVLGFTATTYTGYSHRHTSWVQSAGTKQELINKIEIELLAVGWTTISGSGTTNLLMQSALSPPGQNLQMRLRVKDNAGNCVTISIENVAGTKVGTNSTTAGMMLLPAVSKNWLFTCNRYQCFIRRVVTTAAREFAAFGIPYIPSFLQGVVTEAIWGGGNALSDTDVTLRTSLRSQLGWTTSGITLGNCAAITNGNIWENNNASGQQIGVINLPPFCPHPAVGALNYSYHDGSAILYDTLIGWGLTAVSDVAKFRGQLWDAVLSTEAYAGDLTTSFDSHNWIILTDNNVGGSNNFSRGTLLLVTP